MKKILIVEDNKKISKILKDYLEKEGYICIVVDNGLNVLAIFEKYKFDLIILDIMLPGIDGFTICSLIRSISDIPILILTVKNEESDKLKGYDLGADDYIVKPFSPRVLVAKVKALLKRSNLNNYNEEVIRIGNITMNLNSRVVYVNGELVDLTFKEYEILYLFMRNENIVLSREELLNKVWGYDYIGNTRTVDTHIKTLRKKLGIAGIQIVTMIRTGYKFEK